MYNRQGQDEYYLQVIIDCGIKLTSVTYGTIQILETLNLLPMIKPTLSIKGWWEGGVKGETRHVGLQYQGMRRPEGAWQKVHADQEYVLQIDLKRINTIRVMNCVLWVVD